MSYLVVKSLHLFFVVAWFAGLFYLPRLYVNLAMSETPAERERLLLMSGKLYRFMTPLAGLAHAREHQLTVWPQRLYSVCRNRGRRPAREAHLSGNG